jgi:Ca2+-binding RTX toxin-like protein
MRSTQATAISILALSLPISLAAPALAATINGASGDDQINSTASADTIRARADSDAVKSFGGSVLPPVAADDRTVNNRTGSRVAQGEIIDAGWIDLEMPRRGRLSTTYAVTTTRRAALSFSDHACAGDRMQALDGERMIGNGSPLVVAPRCNARRQGDAAFFDRRFSAGLVLLRRGEHRLRFRTLSTFTGGFSAQFRVDTCTVTKATDGALRGGSGDDIICGGREDDTLIGDGGSDLLLGASGPDVVLAADGAMVAVAGGAGADALVAGVGTDRLFGGSGSDLLRAGPGDDGLTGQTGHDVLVAGRGNDALHGGAGRDALRGGPGLDICLEGRGAGGRSGCETTELE